MTCNFQRELPGTELAHGHDWTKYDSTKNPYHTASAVHDPEFAKVVNYYHKKAIKSFYFSPRYLLKQTKMLFYPRRMYFAFKSLFRLIKDILKS